MAEVSRDYAPPRAVLEARKRMNDTVRRHFDAAGFLEVDTPIAVGSPGLEPHLEAFETTEIGPDQAAETLYLHTSPEYAMKRLLGRGLGHIYQVARVFRNGERSSTHAPEFTMLEWYRQPGVLQDIMQDTEDLVAAVADAVDGPWRPTRARRLSVSEAFLQAGLADPLEHLGDIEGLRAGLRIPEVEGDTWDDVFFRAFFEAVEGTFAENEVTLLHGYPAPMAALARIDPENSRRALRFEVYVGRLELGNAFDELTDPVEQRARFAADLELRRSLGRPLYPVDEGLLADLGNIGAAAGIAIGLDRLLMRCLDLPSVHDTLCFSPRDE